MVMRSDNYELGEDEHFLNDLEDDLLDRGIELTILKRRKVKRRMVTR